MNPWDAESFLCLVRMLPQPCSWAPGNLQAPQTQVRQHSRKYVAETDDNAAIVTYAYDL